MVNILAWGASDRRFESCLPDLWYLTDGVHLYEIIRDHRVTNYGLTGGLLGDTLVQDCFTDEVRAMPELERRICRDVSIGA